MNNRLLIQKEKTKIREDTFFSPNNPSIEDKVIIKIPRDLKSNHKYFVNSLFCEMFDKI